MRRHEQGYSPWEWPACQRSQRPDGTFLSDFEREEIRPNLFLAACGVGREGLVSKHRTNRTAESRHRVRVKNPRIPRWRGPLMEGPIELFLPERWSSYPLADNSKPPGWR